MTLAINGVPIFEDPECVGTREIVQYRGRTYVHSFGCLLQMLVARARWHDERGGCPTWTGGPSEIDGRCCCDVEFEGGDLGAGCDVSRPIARPVL